MHVKTHKQIKLILKSKLAPNYCALDKVFTTQSFQSHYEVLIFNLILP
jgi:hypothetical protein